MMKMIRNNSSFAFANDFLTIFFDEMCLRQMIKVPQNFPPIRNEFVLMLCLDKKFESKMFNNF